MGGGLGRGPRPMQSICFCIYWYVLYTKSTYQASSGKQNPTFQGGFIIEGLFGFEVKVIHNESTDMFVFSTIG